MSLSTLPVELLGLILEHCPTQAISSLRLTCKRISRVADEHFLRSTTLFYVRDDFDTVERLIQQNPRIANSLAQVTFQTDHLRPLHEYGSWRRLRDLSQVTIETSTSNCYKPNARLFQELSKGSKSRRPDPAFQHYTQQWHDQENLYREKRTYTCFHKLFTTCPKLDHISIATGPDHGRPQSWKTVEVFRKGVVCPKGPDLHGYVNSDLTKAVTRAARDSGKNLKTITIEPISLMYFYSAGAFDIASVLYNLENLRLHICKEDRPRQQSQARSERLAEDRGIANFISRAPNLRSLEITSSASGQSMAPLHSIIDASTTWSYLKTLALTTFEFSPQNFASLLLRHKDTLEILKLCDVVFVGADLQTCLELVAGQLSKLKSVHLKGRLVVEAVDGRLRLLHFREVINASILEAYILRGGVLPVDQLAMYGG